MTIKIYGTSDDLVEIWGCRGEDEFGCWGPDPGVPNGIFSLECGDEKMRIYAFYGIDNACWSFALGIADEDVPLPAWPIRFSAEGYSLVVEIDAPAGTQVRRLDVLGRAVHEDLRRPDASDQEEAP